MAIFSRSVSYGEPNAGSDGRQGPRWLKRRQLWVDPVTQLSLLKDLAITMMVGCVLALAIFHVVGEARTVIAHAKDWTEILFGWLYAAAMVAVAAGMVFIVGVFYSHRVAGPVIKLSRVAHEVSLGDLRDSATLRESDHLKTVARELNAIVERLTADARESRAIAELLAERVRSDADPELDALVRRLHRHLERWKLPDAG